MLKLRAKFRVLCMLALLVLVNIVIFRSYLYQHLGTFGAPKNVVGHDVSPASWRKVTSKSGTTPRDSTTSGSKSIKTVARVTSVKGTAQTSVKSTAQSSVKSSAQTSVKSTGQTSVKSTAQTFVKDMTQSSIKSTAQTSAKSTGPPSVKSRGQPSVNGTAEEPSSTVHTQSPDGAGRPLEVLGKLVRPLANVTAPWKQGNRSTALCPPDPPNLVGRVVPNLQAPNWTAIADLNPGLEPGGYYRPADCEARHRIAIIVPYRARDEHLRVLLNNLHPFLRKQQLEYFILVVELALPTTFNRGMLLNIGVVEAAGLWRHVQCFILHDVDLLPEDDRNLYTCPAMSRHMSVAVDKFHYKLLSAGLKVTRYSTDIARYRMIKHTQDKKNEPNPKRYQLLKNFKKRMATDGLNSLQYEVHQVEFRPVYTWMLVSMDQDKIVKAQHLKKGGWKKLHLLFAG
ncbi:hypothetical protein ACOMHN_033708 [Nucella lapillus]